MLAEIGISGMMALYDQSVLDLVAEVHAADVRACLVITGGGMSAIGALFAVAGASRTVIDAQVPYSRTALDEYLGERAPRHVSAGEAELMARVAQMRAVKLDAGREPAAERIVGISCTAAIATDRDRRGENRCHVAWFDGVRGAVSSLTMTKGMRTRREEEAICGSLVLNALADASGLSSRLKVNLVGSERLVVDGI